MKAIQLTAILLALLAATAPAADHPQWGERFTRNMISAEKNLADTFDPATGKNVRWSVPLGSETHATPVVAGGRVYIGTNNAEARNPAHQGDRGILLCLDEKDGRFLWQLVVPKIDGDIYKDWPSGGLCSPPTVEGDRVYVLSSRGEVLCLDREGMANGNQGPYTDEARHMIVKGGEAPAVTPADADILWMFDLVSQAGIWPHDAAHGSVLIDGPLLYVNTGNGVDNTHRKIRCPDAPVLVVIEKATGRLVAKDDERIGDRIVHSAWSSPAMGEIGGRKVIVLGGPDGIVYVFEALTGVPPEGKVETLKKIAWFDCDPAAPKTETHTYMANRKVSPSNIKGTAVFTGGRVYVASGGDIWWGKHEARLQCLNPAGAGDLTKTGLVWTYPLARHSASTPSVYNGLAFITDCGKLIHCVDAATGQPLWTHETRGDYWGSTLAADGKVYALSRRGECTILAAGREKKVLATVELGSPSSSTPVAANGVLYFATYKHLFAVEKKE